jgi:hypothetical protein
MRPMCGFGGNCAPKSLWRSEKQTETAEAHREMQNLRHANEAGLIPTGRPMDALLCQGMPVVPWMQQDCAFR